MAYSYSCSRQRLAARTERGTQRERCYLSGPKTGSRRQCASDAFRSQQPGWERGLAAARAACRLCASLSFLSPQLAMALPFSVSVTNGRHCVELQHICWVCSRTTRFMSVSTHQRCYRYEHSQCVSHLNTLEVVQIWTHQCVIWTRCVSVMYNIYEHRNVLLMHMYCMASIG